MEVKQRVLQQWSTSLDPIGHAQFECVYPLSEAELEHVLAWIDLIRKQVSRFSDAAALKAELGKAEKLAEENERLTQRIAELEKE